MRQPNHHFVSNNKACVCITAQLYDRRALDGPIPTLPLISSLTHLSYLTSTSPRIREILTLDGGLERLVSIVGRALDAAAKLQRPCSASDPFSTSLSRPANDAASTYRPSDPQQGGPFRSFASYSRKAAPVASTSAIPLSTDETLMAELAAAPIHPSAPAAPSAAPINKADLTPSGSIAYSRSLLICYTLSLQALVNVGVRGSESVRTRAVEAGVLSIAARVLSGYLQDREARAASAANRIKAQNTSVRTLLSGGPQADQQRPEAISTAFGVAPIPILPIAVDGERHDWSMIQHLQHAAASTHNLAPLAVPLLSSAPPTRTGSPDSAILASGSSSTQMLLAQANAAAADGSSDDGDREEEPEEEEMEACQPRGRSRSSTVKSASRHNRPESMDRGSAPEPPSALNDVAAALVGAQSAFASGGPAPMDIDGQAEDDGDTVMGSGPSIGSPGRTDNLLLSPAPSLPLPMNGASTSNATASTSKAEDGFRYREEEILLSLQLLAYLSKYPHVRAVFHNPNSDYLCGEILTGAHPPPAPLDKATNIFTLVERFTVRPSPGDRISPRFPNEVQYWAGVIMRNACRKDDARGGIRQCANMLCGQWEKFPREFAKCRRCRKAKYCSKACQSRAWQGGHRYWCSAREPGEPSSQLSAQSIATAAALIDRYLATNPSINATARSPAEARQIAEAAIRRAPLGDPAIAALLVEAAARTGVTPEVAATALAGARSGTLRALVAGHRRRPAPPQNEDDDRDETEDLHDPTAHDAAIEIAGDDSQPLDLLRGSPDIEDDLGL